MTNQEQIQALIDAGDKATQGEWVTHRYSATTLLKDDQRGLSVCSCSFSGDQNRDQSLNDCEFLRLSANSRPAISAMLEENVRMRKALEEIAYMGFDCPAALGHMTDEQWIRNLNGKKQLIAKQALEWSE